MLKPDLVILDGIKDLCRNIMDNPESTDVLDLLSRLSQDNNTAICCILHENKSSADSNMRGHLGTELINKCTEEYQVTKKDNVITIEQTVSRDAPLYDKLEFTIEEDGMPSEIAIAMKTHKNSIQKQSPRPITGGSFSLTKAVTPEKSCTVSLWRAERKTAPMPMRKSEPDSTRAN